MTWQKVVNNIGRLRVGRRVMFAYLLLLYPLRVRIAQRLKLERVPYLPHQLDVEPIDICNFACDHCQVTHWIRELATRLNPERFRAILRQFPRIRHIKLQGMGEPLLNKSLLDMLEEAERQGIATQITSNGSVYTDRIAKRLLALRKATLIFSIDGATAATFEAIRVNGKFQAVTEHIADLTRRRGAAPWPRIEINAVATARNMHELPDLVRLAKSLGVDNLAIRTRLEDFGKDEMQESIVPINVSRGSRTADQLLDEAEKVGAEIGMPLVITRGQRYSTASQSLPPSRDSLPEKRSKRRSSARRCRWPWNSAYIAANGDVVPCCMIGDSGVVKMGNVFAEPFSQIWNNDKYRTLRRRIANDDIPNYCRSCYGMRPVAADVAPAESSNAT